jgi:sulfotransferase
VGVALNFVALSGLPRTGSTLLSAILDQNPEVHAEGNSAVCQLMWDMQQSCENSSSEQLEANYRESTQDDLVRAIPAIYYKDSKATHIIDKCRSWTLPDNIKMLKRYVRDDPKVIVLTRPIDEIVQSFVELRKANGWQGDVESDLLIPDSEPIMRSLNGVKWAQENNNGEFLFIEYEDLVQSTAEVIDSIYTFCGMEQFMHDFNSIKNNHPENDLVYGLIGHHEIRSQIGVR